MKQTVFHVAPPPSYAAEDFVSSACNALVMQWLDAWPNWPSYAAVVVGPKASGKTHLLHRWVSASGGQFVVASDSTCEQTTPLAIDDADGWVGEAAETKLFHMLNQTKERGQTMLLTGLQAPSDWPIKLKDLRSRLLSLPVWQMNAPDDALLSAVLAKHFSDRQVLVDPAVVQYIAMRTERSFEAIDHVAKAIDHFALEAGRPITTALVRKWMESEA